MRLSDISDKSDARTYIQLKIDYYTELVKNAQARQAEGEKERCDECRAVNYIDAYTDALHVIDTLI